MADLREALTTALESHEGDTSTVVNTPDTSADVVVNESAQQRADRERDEAGRFKAKDGVTDVVAKAPAPAPLTAPPAVEPRKPPSSWKKDYWDAYQKLDPNVAKYISEREEQFANGVSTYKQEAERAKEMFEAIAPFQQDLQQHGIAPAQWIRNLGTAHQTLVKGSPEQKIQMFRHLAQQYGVPVENIVSGQVDPLMQYLTPLQEQVQQLKGQLTGWQEEQQKQENSVIQSEIAQFSSGNEHFEAVRETMAGLLQAGLATDLKSAYDKAIRMNDDLWKAEQLRASEDAEKQRREQAAANVKAARANAVSPRSATPTGAMASTGKKDLRSQLEETVDSVLGGARV